MGLRKTRKFLKRESAFYVMQKLRVFFQADSVWATVANGSDHAKISIVSIKILFKRLSTINF